tara:strand:+ start:639 stop:953 length:315 start_codon:yes stop_codon:yes gene_type:complete
MLKKFQDMGKLLKQAQEMKGAMQEVQKELKSSEIEVVKLNNLIKIVITGEMEVKSIEVAPELLAPANKDKLQKGLQEAMNEAVKRAKDLATSKLSKVSGGLMPG